VQGNRNRLGGFGLALCFTLISGTALAQDRVDALIERLERQELEIQALRQEVQELREQGPKIPNDVPGDAPYYQKEDGEERLTEYENPRIHVDISGQINQAVNFLGDGKDARALFVDNDASNSRLRIAGVSVFDDGPQVGTTLELAFSGNNSFDVSQDNETASDFLQVRRAEVFVLDERLGRLMFGRGSASADNTAEFNLSRVSGPIMTSGVSFPIGGVQFTDGDMLTGLTVDDAFFNFDGGRQNRVRYDTPMFGPVQLAISAGADQRLDASLTFGSDFDRWTGVELGPLVGLGGVSISDPSNGDADFRVAGSGSLLHPASGLSATVSSGFDAGSEGDTPYNVYGQLGWDAELLSFGTTGFGVDYTWTENRSADDDQGQSVGLAVVQALDRYGIELYSQLRWLTLDRDAGESFDDLWIGTVGTRVRF